MKNITKLTIAGILALTVNFALAEPREGKEGGKKGKKDRGEIFLKLDADGSGTLSMEELLESKRIDGDEEKAEKVFAHIDADGDGVITEEEFTSAKPPKGKGKGKGKKEKRGEDA